MSITGKNTQLIIPLFAAGALFFIAATPCLGTPKDPTETWYENPRVKAEQDVTVFKEITAANSTQQDPTQHWYFSGAPKTTQESGIALSVDPDKKAKDFKGDPTESWYDNKSLVDRRE